MYSRPSHLIYYINSITVDDLRTKYGAEFFCAAFARFVVLKRNSQMTRTRLEQDILDVYMPFTSVSVYHHIRYQEDDGSDGTIDSICIQPCKKDKNGGMVGGRFDTALVHTGEGNCGGIHGTSVHTFVVFISLKCK